MKYMEHLWDDNDRGEMKYLKQNLFQYYFVQHRFHTDRAGTEPGLHGETYNTENRTMY